MLTLCLTGSFGNYLEPLVSMTAKKVALGTIVITFGLSFALLVGRSMPRVEFELVEFSLL